INTPTFTGTAEANSTVELFRGGGTSLGTTTADGSGNWSTTIAALAAGTYSITAKATDSSGNTSAASGGLSITIDTGGPTVTLNQAGTQADPTNGSTINFTVVFSESVSDFASGGVTLSGTAGATTATVTGGGTTYNVAVSGMTSDGTVIATIAAGVAHDTAGNQN